MSAVAVQDRIEKSVALAATPERVWEALTTPEQLTQWFYMSEAVLDLGVGGECTFRFKDPDQSVGRAVLQTIDPPRKLAWQWSPTWDEDKTKPLAGQENLTTVEFTLEPTEQGTFLTVVEHGFATLDAMRGPKAFEDHKGGWDWHMGNLDLWLSGKPING